jgi:hypothetical protein
MCKFDGATFLQGANLRKFDGATFQKGSAGEKQTTLEVPEVAMS